MTFRPRVVVISSLVIVVLLVAAYGVVSSRAVSLSRRSATPAPQAATTDQRLSPRSQPAASPIRRLVGLGDSVPVGMACSCAPYVSLVASQLAASQHMPVTATNLASPGQTTQGLIAQVQQPSTVNALRNADAVILTVGANDLEEDSSCSPAASSACYDPDLQTLGSAYARLLTRVRALIPSRARVIVTGYWNVFLDGDVARQMGNAYVRNSDVLTRAVNAVIASNAVTDAVEFVDVYTAFRGDGDRDDTHLLAADGDHPNAAGHRLIAQEITGTLLGGPGPAAGLR